MTAWKWEKNNLDAVKVYSIILTMEKADFSEVHICFGLCGLLCFHLSPRNTGKTPLTKCSAPAVHWSCRNWSHEMIYNEREHSLRSANLKLTRSDCLFCPGWIPPLLITCHEKQAMLSWVIVIDTAQATANHDSIKKKLSRMHLLYRSCMQYLHGH